jgi:hypothetical protein
MANVVDAQGDAVDESTLPQVKVPIGEFSRLNYAQLVMVNNGSDDIIFFDLPLPPRAGTAKTDKIVTVERSKRIDIMSFERYEDASIWDVIAEANGLMDLPSQLMPSDDVRLPSQGRVVTELRKK